MNLAEAMAALEAAGKENTAKIYRRHGATDPVFGVPYGELNKLERKIKTNHDLAMQLWDTGNHDAMVLATKVADPDEVTVAAANHLAAATGNYVIAEAVAGLVARSPAARSRADLWRNRKSEWIASIGWGVVARTAEDPDMWSTEELGELLTQIEAEIHDRPNRVRHEMVMATICIGLRDATRARQAKAVAKRIGPVEVDHGETNCSTPEPIAYIDKTLAHRAKKAAASK